ncbi:hypothetical protein L6452_13166 [Arctium lappa]|uniref:Uncharacterized protein n=1 Tax=Arctium lappa TaxID=4217 RepID=A0ACB9CHT7_ARCLA|nr:hypothetical protein L6452_13166 [Arctium lappa]
MDLILSSRRLMTKVFQARALVYSTSGDLDWNGSSSVTLFDNSLVLITKLFVVSELSGLSVQEAMVTRYVLTLKLFAVADQLGYWLIDAINYHSSGLCQQISEVLPKGICCGIDEVLICKPFVRPDLSAYRLSGSPFRNVDKHCQGPPSSIFYIWGCQFESYLLRHEVIPILKLLVRPDRYPQKAFRFL